MPVLWHADSDGLCRTFFPFHDTKVFLFRYISATIWRGVSTFVFWDSGYTLKKVGTRGFFFFFFSLYGFSFFGSKRGFSCFHCALLCFISLVLFYYVTSHYRSWPVVTRHERSLFRGFEGFNWATFFFLSLQTATLEEGVLTFWRFTGISW
ncbi:hypothetical protein QBC42DRAFT_108419 [Cladorrhinum samala]|uniref:Uncharacterized protein n=1 Tax=Cladorrhinum samala TaxID=585594 RepID=A0AAV9HZP7_9PEZI|nr:hypothetical protein QBC42DRAFT_108419 [Cladorrhinum samala]